MVLSCQPGQACCILYRKVSQVNALYLYVNHGILDIHDWSFPSFLNERIEASEFMFVDSVFNTDHQAAVLQMIVFVQAE